MLNEEQRRAVLHGDAPLLVLSGAGSGKTTVIVHRICHLARACGVPARRILAVTFTNKAAEEMRNRVALLLGEDEEAPLTCTFHGLCARMLRAHADTLPPPLPCTQEFTILDQRAAKELMTSVAAKVQPAPSQASVDDLAWSLAEWRNAGLEPDDVEVDGDEAKHALEVYRQYRLACQQADKVDFADLIMHVLRGLRDRGAFRTACRALFTRVLVDEFQDTNPAQYSLLRELLPADGTGLTVVGDDCQAIHEWRGATVENILNFQRHFPTADVVIMQQNYRSKRFIVEAANALISNKATRRADKVLVCTRQAEECAATDKIQLVRCCDEAREAAWIVQRIGSDIAEAGRSPRDIAVLYRVHSQSVELEAALRLAGVPYRIHGSAPFYQRQEIRVLVEYLRLALGPVGRESDANFETVVNVPPRGVGHVSVDRLRAAAAARGVSMAEACTRRTELGIAKVLTARAWAGLDDFARTVKELRAKAQRGDSLASLCRLAVETTEYEAYLRKRAAGDGEQAVNNVQDFARLLDARQRQADSREQVLAEIALCSDADDGEPAGEHVSLMSLHASKGLEFPVVFMAGVTDDYLPHRMSSNVEEERRLCYVGMTRAKDVLRISCPSRRFDRYAQPSRFIDEIPRQLLMRCRPAV